VSIYFFIQNLILLFEYYTNGYDITIIYTIFFLAVLTGIFVIITKNPVISVLFLITLFLIMSGYLMLLGISFIGLSYILVYVGAVSILFLFILMLINIRISELVSNTSNSLVLGGLVIYIFFTNIDHIIQYISEIDILYLIPNLNISINSYSYENDILRSTLAVYWDGNLAQISHISTIGNIIYTNYFIWLILSSIILLLAMIGAIIITITDNKAIKTIF
jgi:NADH-ubiquinone oxidoreductase chain 6